MSAERWQEYIFVPPTGDYDWWEITDMIKSYAVVTVQASMPNAEKIARLAWAALKGE